MDMDSDNSQPNEEMGSFSVLRPPKAPAHAVDFNNTKAPPTDELRILKKAMVDLQTKRSSALKLYHEEKALREQETSRIAQLTAHLNSLQQQLQQHSSDAYSKRDNVGQFSETAFRHVTCLPSITAHSLTWYSLSMENAVPSLCTTIALLDSNGNTTSLSQTVHSDSDSPHSVVLNSDVHESRDEIQQLRQKVKHSQTETTEMHAELMKSYTLMAELKEQLQSSTQACKDLIQTIHEQEETISQLS